MRPAPALHNIIIINITALEIIIAIIISKHLLDFKTKQFENVSSPPLMLHAGGGGGAGDMPCLPHLDQRGELEILMTHGDREKIILQQENLLFN